MIVEVLLMVLGYLLLPGHIVYIVAAMKLMLVGILASVIGFLKATLGYFILLFVTVFMNKDFEKSSESESELEPTYSSADVEDDELSKKHCLLTIIFLTALCYYPSFRKCVAYALCLILVVGALAKMNNK